MEEVEKVLCVPNQSNDTALIASMMNNGGWNNNPFIYLVWLMFANRMYGNDNYGCNANLSNQMQDNQNANLIMDAVKGNSGAIATLSSNLNCDFNAMNGAINDVRSAIQHAEGVLGISSERIINAAQMGDSNIVSTLQNCCCATQKEIISLKGDLALSNCQQTNALTSRIDQLANGITQGFSAVAYNSQAQTAALQNSGEKNTQRIIDTLNTHWSQDLSNQLWQARLALSQKEQNETLISALKTTA